MRNRLQHGVDNANSQQQATSRHSDEGGHGVVPEGTLSMVTGWILI